MKTWRCPKCGHEFGYTQPVCFDGMRGHATTLHGCGEQFQAVSLKPGSADAKEFWDDVRDALEADKP